MISQKVSRPLSTTHVRLLLICLCLAAVLCSPLLSAKKANAATLSAKKASVATCAPCSYVTDDGWTYDYFNTVRIQATDGYYVSEEQQYTGDYQNILRARTPASSLGTWEEFYQYEREDCRFDYACSAIPMLFQASNGYFVTEEQGWTGGLKDTLRARASSNALGTWQMFTESLASNTTSLNCVNLQASDGYFVSEEQHYAGGLNNLLRARTSGDSLGSWESFCFSTI